MVGCKCIDCGKELSKKIYKRCISCNKKGKLNHRWIGGLPICKNCGNRCKFSMSKYCMKCFQLGDRNHAWRGGVIGIKNTIRNSRRYKIWRKEIFERDNYTCQKCFKRGGYLEAHHIIPLFKIISRNNITTIEEAMECMDIWEPLIGETLCYSCHLKTRKSSINSLHIKSKEHERYSKEVGRQIGWSSL